MAETADEVCLHDSLDRTCWSLRQQAGRPAHVPGTRHALARIMPEARENYD